MCELFLLDCIDRTNHITQDYDTQKSAQIQIVMHNKDTIVTATMKPFPQSVPEAKCVNALF